jgi:hypothetical protein
LHGFSGGAQQRQRGGCRASGRLDGAEQEVFRRDAAMTLSGGDPPGGDERLAGLVGPVAEPLVPAGRQVRNWEHRGGGVRVEAGVDGAGLREHADHFVAHLVQVDAQRLQDARRDPLALADEAEQQVFSTDVVVTESLRLVDRELDHVLGARRQSHLARDGATLSPNDELDRHPDLRELDAHVLEHPAGDTLALADEGEQQVLGTDGVVVEPLSLVLSQCQDLSRPVRELVEAIHVGRTLPTRC